MQELTYYDMREFEKWALAMDFTISDLLFLQPDELDVMIIFWKENIMDQEAQLRSAMSEARMKFMKEG